MAGSETRGKATKCNFERSEDDTDDLVLILRDATGALVDTTSFTAALVLDADPEDDSADHTFNGTGSGLDGLITIDMSTFAAPVGSYSHDIRITDAASASRVYFRGSFKVVERIN